MPASYYTVGPGVLTIGETSTLEDFSAQCTSCKLTPSVDNGDPINVLSGEQVPGDRSESFSLDGTLLQEMGEDGTTEWLFNHRGEQHPFTYVPASASSRAVTGQLVVEAIDIGGDVKTKPTSDFSFIVVGEPAIGAAPAGTEAAAPAKAAKDTGL